MEWSPGNERGDGPSGEALTHDRIRRIVGDIDDITAAKIIATGAKVRDLEAAGAWFSGPSDVMGKLVRRPVVGVVAQVFDILKKTQEPLDEDIG